MSESDGISANAPEERPEIAMRKRRGPSIVWLIPLVALVVAGWLVFTTFAEKGPEVTITFRTAEGLEAGKTKIKYRELDVGQIKDITILPDLSGVQVRAELQKDFSRHLGAETRFWVVRPMLTAGGVTGLSTIVAGSHIEIDPVEGELREHFTGIEEPPLVRSDEAGREFLLEAERVGSISRGSVVSYRGIAVGEVMAYELAENQQYVEVRIFVKEPFDALVRPSTRFWNASGITASVGADGLQVSTESLSALLTGGIAFQTAPGAMREAPSPENAVFKLFESRDAEQDERYATSAVYMAHFEGSVRGLAVGAPVEFRGIRIGTVTNVSLVFDHDTFEARVPVVFEIEAGRVKGVEASSDPHGTLAELVRRGLRAKLVQGSLLTGQLLVSLDFYPDAEPAELKLEDLHPEIPTLPSDLEQITRSIDTVLTKLAELPVEELMDEARLAVQNINALPIAELTADARDTVRSLKRLVDGPEIRGSLAALDRSLAGVDRIVANADRDLGPLLKSLREASEAGKDTIIQAQKTLKSADTMIGERSEVRHQLVTTLSELAEAARSIRLLADYLERHPDALVRGKGE